MNLTIDMPGGGRRRYPRAAGPFSARRLEGRSVNPVEVLGLAVGGCFIKAPKRQEVGHVCSLTIDLGQEGSVDVFATTLYHQTEGSAVTFFNLDESAFEKIRRTVDKTLS